MTSFAGIADAIDGLIEQVQAVVYINRMLMPPVVFRKVMGRISWTDGDIAVSSQKGGTDE